MFLVNILKHQKLYLTCKCLKVFKCTQTLQTQMFSFTGSIFSMHSGLQSFLMHIGLQCEYFQYEQSTIISVSAEEKVLSLISRVVSCSWSHPDNLRRWSHKHIQAGELARCSQMHELTRLQSLAFQQQRVKFGTQINCSVWMFQD